MTIAIVCPGPSLPQEWSTRTATPEVVIAVNGAADLVPCDWWVAGDCEAFALWPRVRPALGVFHQTHTKSIPRPLRGLLLRHWDDIRCPRHPLPWHYSMQAAVALAGQMAGGQVVEIYGATWAGTGYACSHNAKADDMGDRWERERAAVEATATIYQTRFRRMTMQNPTNRMAQPAPDWEPATISQVQVRTVCCPTCGSPRTKLRRSWPERETEQRICEKCGGKFAVARVNDPHPVVRRG